MQLTFRPALEQDVPLLQDLAARIWRASYAGIISPAQIDYMLRWMYSTETISAELRAGVIWMIAERGGEPAGFFSVTIHSAAQAELNKIYLLPSLQGSGHGQAMIGQAVAVVAARGCNSLRLRVNKANARALRAYERAGFRRVDSVVSDIGGGFVMDDHILTRELS